MAARKKLVLGDRCPAVTVLQALLTTDHFMRDGKKIIDDEFGDGTLAGVRAFQE